jgi:hypothetical protein
MLFYDEERRTHIMWQVITTITLRQKTKNQKSRARHPDRIYFNRSFFSM